MSPSKVLYRRRRRRALGLTVALIALAALAVTVALSSAPGPGATAAAASASGEAVPRTDDSVPAQGVVLFGASPAEAPDEAWGIGRSLGKTVIVRYDDSGWSVAPSLQDASGATLEGFELAHPEAGRFPVASPLAGQMTQDGSGALLGTVNEGGGKFRSVLITRDPGDAFKEVPAAPAESEAALRSGERLFGVNRAPMVAALEEAGGKAGALVVPVDEGGEHIEDSVLYWNGQTQSWSREQIEVPSSSTASFHVLALGASSPQNAWLLAALAGGGDALFRREVRPEGEPTVWQPVALSGGEAGGPLTVPTTGESQQFAVEEDTKSQILTVTDQGVWVDGLRADVHASTSVFVEPDGPVSAHVAHSWCPAPEGAAACQSTMPMALPSTGGRSFAWPGGGEYGERVITGLLAGTSLRLEGSAFRLVTALGGGPGHEVGSDYGAAFASAQEGWLGDQLLPVHITRKSLPNLLAPWPVPFRKPLLALAAEPGAPVGSLNSEVLAVGDRGEVARYVPGSGWRPESLLGTGQRHETPRLRAVDWPRPSRAYAVGDEGAMWLWRGETGLWETDPATPLNFRGNLLGVAFDPTNSARGYAVGESGVLLGYGKTWQQEALPAEHPCTPINAGNAEEAARCSTWSDANFTSVAFAGSQAIVAYRVLLSISSNQYRGGLLVNNGSGWQIDGSAAAALGTATPYAVAGLPDGGAAIGVSLSAGGAIIDERQAAGAAWEATPTPYPSTNPPGSLALFREGGALRAIGSGSVPSTVSVESEQPPPAGFPPNLLAPYPVETRAEQGVLRQTATGWRDEEHELNDVKDPPGDYEFYDTVYQPDPVAAVLVSESGGEGWAVGGFINGNPLLETADVDRYPADGSTPTGIEGAPIVTEPAKGASFAIGGNSQCEAPCGLERNAGLGPDRWLANAVAQARSISGLRDFLYTGTRVTSGRTSGPATRAIPYGEEQERYGELLAGEPAPAASPTDRDGSGSLTTFQQQFGLAQPYYSFVSPGSPSVRVIVLAEQGEVESEQRTWAQGQVQEAIAQGQPAIVIGNANLAVLAAKHVTWAQELIAALQGASAYFFDAPGENIETRIGNVPAFGSGTLGYVPVTSEKLEDFHGAGGFLLAEVGAPGSAKNEPGEHRALVTVRLIPDISELALEAVDGTLLQRSQAALFDGLARRPRSGNRAHNESTESETDPYVPIPERCRVAGCEGALLPEFSLSSSRKGVGDFVLPQFLGTGNPRSVKLVKGKPVTMKEAEESKNRTELNEIKEGGLFCAFNEGETVVTITAGGLSAKLPVKVEAGSVRQPCGTVKAEPVAAGEVPISAPAPVPVHPPAVVPPFFVQSSLTPFIPAILPPPLPQPARPTPPSGTSAVTQPVEAPEKEEEEEAAPESVSAEASAYAAHEHELPTGYILGVIVLAAFAGASLRGGVGRRRKHVRVAPATINSMRAQRRLEREWERNRRR